MGIIVRQADASRQVPPRFGAELASLLISPVMNGKICDVTDVREASLLGFAAARRKRADAEPSCLRLHWTQDETDPSDELVHDICTHTGGSR